MNLMAMDFVLQVTVVELVFGTLDGRRLLSFELSRGSKVRFPAQQCVSREDDGNAGVKYRYEIFFVFAGSTFLRVCLFVRCVSVGFM